MDWHNRNAEEILNEYNVKVDQGLNAKQVKKQREKYGFNKLKEKKKKSIIAKFIHQFSDFMVIILLIASLISFITDVMDASKDYVDSIIILFIVVVNAIIGVIQESKAEKAIEALQKLSAPKAKVIRNGKEFTIDSDQVVPGDILILETGDFICADARIIEAYNLKTEESSLTGESLPVDKSTAKIESKGTSLGEKSNMVFATSTVISGRAVAVVTNIGMQTEVGKIATMLNEEESPQTPLQNRLEQVSKILGIGVLIICLIIFILGIIEKVPAFEMFMISISLAVAAIPEGLPAVVTIVLAMGVRRMAASRAIIRKLPAVETLGSATVICSDKTGTLTQNKMTVTQIRSFDGKLKMDSNESIEILSYSVLCNNSNLTGSIGNFKASGNPTEIAMVLAAAKFGKNKNTLDSQFKRVDEIPFDSSRKLMTTVHELGKGHYRVITKGAPDVLLKKCTRIRTKHGIEDLSFDKINTIENNNKEMADQALRVLAVAFKDIDSLDTKMFEEDLCFCGLIGMIDPPRLQAKQAVKDCISAGIKPVMITGDHIITAKAIGRELGILKEKDKAMTGAELDNMSKEHLEKHIFEYSVFARVTPEHKVRIVKAFQNRGAVVAMTGDGVNDAPALKVANIGCAMGITGTDVAKGSADMILTDDNFATIVEAVKQGRGIFENIKKTIHFLISSNIGELITVLVAFLLKLPAPLLAIQLLWINLVTDSLPALALGVEPVDEDIMTKKPQDPNKSFLSGAMGYYIAIEGAFIGAISFLAFTIGRVFFDIPGNLEVARTMAFSVLSLSQLVHAFNVRSDESLMDTGIFGNAKMVGSFIICLILQLSVVSVDFLSAIFKTASLNFIQWFIVAILSISPLVLVEIEKRILKYKRNKNTI